MASEAQNKVNSPARMAATVVLAIVLSTLIVSPARAQAGSVVAVQCWVNGALVTVQGGSCPAASATSQTQTAMASGTMPSGVQLLNAATNPTLRIPVDHICESPRGGMFIRMSGSHGWLEISKTAVRYLPTHRGRFGSADDRGFEQNRYEITEVETMTTAGGWIRNLSVKFRTQKIVHYFAYSAPEHWDSRDKGLLRSDDIYSPLIHRAMRNLDGTLADFGIKQAAAPAPVVAATVVSHEITTPPPPPTPPVIVLLSPAGAQENSTLDIGDSPITIRGLAMDSSGLPTVSINGVAAALRAKDAHAAEFWSDPLPLQPGSNPIQISASNSAHATARLDFRVQYTPKAMVVVNPKALDKADIISLLVGGVPADRVAQVVKDRGTKFVPTAEDLKVIRAAGGTDEVIEAIQKAAPPHP